MKKLRSLIAIYPLGTSYSMVVKYTIKRELSQFFSTPKNYYNFLLKNIPKILGREINAHLMRNFLIFLKKYFLC